MIELEKGALSRDLAEGAVELDEESPECYVRVAIASNRFSPINRSIIWFVSIREDWRRIAVEVDRVSWGTLNLCASSPSLRNSPSLLSKIRFYSLFVCISLLTRTISFGKGSLRSEESYSLASVMSLTPVCPRCHSCQRCAVHSSFPSPTVLSHSLSTWRTERYFSPSPIISFRFGSLMRLLYISRSNRWGACGLAPPLLPASLPFSPLINLLYNIRN